ncbi:hypothetical protein CYY_002977 [Polysphondylium violaceum]|uniref:Uncharacterized protein n=1 Tax=Polysphondylium violaceum TaxID=133409 RepID=A0A8J4V953_9MYCE|nr:hypothetical protein CYY_002977 [Polysphondylium violaceum]
MEINNNIIDDNARLQKENWEFKKAGCSNKDHISLILQIEKKDKKLEKRDRIIDQLKIENKNSIQEINNRIDSILKLYRGQSNEIDQFKQEIYKLFNDKVEPSLKNIVLDSQVQNPLSEMQQENESKLLELQTNLNSDGGNGVHVVDSSSKESIAHLELENKKLKEEVAVQSSEIEGLRLQLGESHFLFEENTNLKNEIDKLEGYLRASRNIMKDQREKIRTLQSNK